MKVTDLLRTMDIFQTLPAEELEMIARLLRERRLEEQEVLCRQGDEGDALFIVTGGRIRLSTADPTGGEKVLTHFTDGQFFGEMSLLTGAPRSATATAEMESRVLVLSKEDFDARLGSNPQVMREMLKVVSLRTVQTNQQLLAEDVASAAVTGGGRVLAVFSPRGGSGKTTIAVNLAVALARLMPERVGLLDLDLTFGHAPLLLNLTPETSLADVPPESLGEIDRRTLSQYLVQHPGSLYVLAGATRPEDGEAVTGDHVRAALAVMRRQFLVTVVDCGVSFNDPTLAALEGADRIVLVATPELNTLRDLRECQRIFGEVVHLERPKIYYLMNNYQPFRVLERGQFEEALEVPMALEVPHAGEAAVKAAVKGEPLVLGQPGSAFSRAIERLAQDLGPSEARLIMPRRPVATNGHATPAKSKGLKALFRRG